MDDNEIRTINRSDIFSFLGYLHMRHNYFLEQSSIQELIGYINGYVSGYIYDKSPDNPWIQFENFKYWLIQRNEALWKDSSGSLIMLFSRISEKNGVSSFDQFWIDWNSYGNRLV